jgi:hypothetical protein
MLDYREVFGNCMKKFFLGILTSYSNKHFIQNKVNDIVYVDVQIKSTYIVMTSLSVHNVWGHSHTHTLLVYTLGLDQFNFELAGILEVLDDVSVTECHTRR